jgi:crotonobetaine/carnitine-CoA ligase
VIDEHGNNCTPNQAGQLLLKTNFTALGYFNAPEISSKSFQGEWLHTNDIVYQDEDGYYYFVSRSDHYVKIRGRLVSAVEIENIITSYDGVTECSTSFGLNDGVMEAFSFLVVDDPLLDATAIRARMLTDGYSSHQIPKNIFVTKTLPKTPNGKRIRSLSRLLDQSP